MRLHGQCIRPMHLALMQYNFFLGEQPIGRWRRCCRMRWPALSRNPQSTIVTAAHVQVGTFD